MKASKITRANIGSASLSDLVAQHNALSDKPVKKFSDRKTAERRVLALLDAASTRKVRTPKAKADKAPAAPADRSAAVAASWANPEVAAARAARHSVRVGADVYRSLPAAFRELNLPMGSMIATRLALVANGKAVHANHKFTLVTN